MRVLLTGATGVIGRRLIPLLRAQGHDVTAVARTPAGRAAVERQGATGVALDLFDRNAVERAVDGQDAIVNLATHIPSSSTQIIFASSWRENDRIRREGSATLVDAAIQANVSRFIQESFAPVYPDSGANWIDETTAIAPVKYNRTLSDAEASAYRFIRSGRTGIVLRFAAFYGPDAMQMAEMISFVKKGWAPIPGPADAYFSWVSHDDAASAVAAAIGLPAGILQRRRRRAGHASCLLRLAGPGAQRQAAEAAADLADAAVWIARRDARPIAPHLQPQAAIVVVVDAGVPQRARRTACDDWRNGRTVDRRSQRPQNLVTRRTEHQELRTGNGEPGTENEEDRLYSAVTRTIVLTAR